MTSIDIALAGQLADLMATSPSTPIAVMDSARTIAFVVAADELTALHATQHLLATNGSMAAIAEGLADLAAGREQRWGELRLEHGRGSGDADAQDTDAQHDGAQDGAAGPVVSHRARWDLELLPPAAASACFDVLDQLRERAAGDVGLRLTAGFPGLRLMVSDGYRMVVRPSVETVAVVHVDAVAADVGAAVADALTG